MAEGAAAGGSTPRARDVRLGSSWVVCWDTVVDEEPRVCHVPARPGGATVCRTPSGDRVVFEGYLFDADARGAAPAPSAAALVASAHGRGLEGLIRTLSGAFAVVIWDRSRRRLVVGRDAMGLMPCFYWWNGRTILVSASLDAILARPEVSATFDRAVIAEYLQDRMSSHQVHETFYRDVRRLPSAHILCLERGGFEISRYWDPVPPGFAWATPEEISRFDALLERAVERCLSAGADSITLSGGFDSVSVATMAAGHPGGRRPLHALSLRFAGTACDEASTQVEVARVLGMPQLLLTLDDALRADSLVDAALRLSASSPSPVLSPWQSAYTALFRAASRLGLARSLMGTGGDDLLNVDATYGADCLAALDLPALWRYCRACQRTSPFPAFTVMRAILWERALAPELLKLGRGVLGRLSAPALDWVRRRRRQRLALAWAQPSHRDLARLLEHRRQSAVPIELARGERAYVANIRGLTLAPLFLLERDQSHAWASQLGFTLLYPYFDRDLVDLSMRIPPDALIAGGRHKAPLRRLMAERLPSVAMRPRKVDFTQVVHGVLRPAGRAAWRSLGEPAMLADLGVVDVARLNRSMDDYFTGRSASWLGTWMALSTEAWLRARSGLSFTSIDQEAPA